MEGGGVQSLEVLDWAPSCYGPSLVRDRGWGPSCLLETDLGPERDRAEVSLPSGDQEWTSLRRNAERLAATNSPKKTTGGNKTKIKMISYFNYDNKEALKDTCPLFYFSVNIQSAV